MRSFGIGFVSSFSLLPPHIEWRSHAPSARIGMASVTSDVHFRVQSLNRVHSLTTMATAAQEPVTFYTVTAYFTDIPKSVQKGLNSYNSNRVVSVLMSGGSLTGKVQASMKKKSYDVEVHVEGQEVKASTCSCAIGRAKCHHVAALLIWAEKNLTRTDVECVWKRAPAPKTDEVTAKRVSVIAPSTSQAGIKRPVTQEDREWTLNSLAQLGRFTGLGWILAPETPQTVPIKTFDGVVTSSGYGNAEDKALYVLSSLAVSPQEKGAIERATVGQTKNALWMAYRHKRITASNFGLVLAALKRNSYPPSLFKTLLGQYNLKQGSHACDWGILHEPKAKQEYMERTGVTIQERGVFLSDSGLLGGSPDGTVADDFIIELPLIDPPGPSSTSYNFPDFPLPAQPSNYCFVLSEKDMCSLDVLAITLSQSAALERETRQQDANKTWHLARAPRLTSSVFKSICSRRADFGALAVRLKATSGKQTKAMRRGVELEPEAAQKYTAITGNLVSPVGFVVNPNAPHLGTSPDRRVKDGTSFGLLEIKCPSKSSCQDCPYLQKQSDGSQRLKETHAYYYQIIGQLGLTGMPWCDFFVMCEEDYHLQRIHFDVEK